MRAFQLASVLSVVVVAGPLLRCTGAGGVFADGTAIPATVVLS